VEYRSFTYSIGEVAGKPGKWRWTVKLSEHLHRAGVSSSRKQAEDAAVKAINRALAIKQQLARQSRDPR
jgi:hypothetical protein